MESALFNTFAFTVDIIFFYYRAVCQTVKNYEGSSAHLLFRSTERCTAGCRECHVKLFMIMSQVTRGIMHIENLKVKYNY